MKKVIAIICLYIGGVILASIAIYALLLAIIDMVNKARENPIAWLGIGILFGVIFLFIGYVMMLLHEK